MRQIKHQFTLYFMLLIITAVILFESLIIGYSAHFYTNALYEQLESQGDKLIQTIERGLPEKSLEKLLAEDAGLLGRFGSYRTQIFDKRGQLVIDSSGSWQENPPGDRELSTALRGKTYRTVGKDSRDFISLSLPLITGDEVVGVLRLSASTQPIKSQVRHMAAYFLGIGLAVVIVTGIGAFILAATVTGPIQSLIKATRRMAGGDLTELPQAVYDDEIGELAESIAFFGSEIERRENEKNNMFSSVSHELRTPLTAIRGWAETLADGGYESDPEVVREGLTTISNEALRLTGLVEELLDFTRLSHAQMAFEFEETDLVDVLLTTVSALKPKAAARGIELEAAISEISYEDMGLATATADGARLKQMCLNLLDNSLKFTPRGGKVSISLEAVGQEALICVKDTGAGIDPLLLPKVSERFVKGSHPESHLGLGLSICELIIKAHGGSWHIASELQKGTEISVRLPLGRDEKMGLKTNG